MGIPKNSSFSIKLKLSKFHKDSTQSGYVLEEYHIHPSKKSSDGGSAAQTLDDDPTKLFSYAREVYGREVLAGMRFFVPFDEEVILRKTLERCVALPITESFSGEYFEFIKNHKK